MAGILLNRSRQVPAEDTPAFGGIAERFRRSGDLERAITLCREGLRKFPNQLSARVTLGWALLDKGQYEDAREELEQVLRRAPDNLAAIRGLAELHERSQESMDGHHSWQHQPVDAAHASPAADLAAESEAAGQPVVVRLDPQAAAVPIVPAIISEPPMVVSAAEATAVSEAPPAVVLGAAPQLTFAPGELAVLAPPATWSGLGVMAQMAPPEPVAFDSGAVDLPVVRNVAASHVEPLNLDDTSQPAPVESAGPAAPGISTWNLRSEFLTSAPETVLDSGSPEASGTFVEIALPEIASSPELDLAAGASAAHDITPDVPLAAPPESAGAVRTMESIDSVDFINSVHSTNSIIPADAAVMAASASEATTVIDTSAFDLAAVAAIDDEAEMLEAIEAQLASVRIGARHRAARSPEPPTAFVAPQEAIAPEVQAAPEEVSARLVSEEPAVTSVTEGAVVQTAHEEPPIQNVADEMSSASARIAEADQVLQSIETVVAPAAQAMEAANVSAAPDPEAVAVVEASVDAPESQVDSSIDPGSEVADEPSFQLEPPLAAMADSALEDESDEASQPAAVWHAGDVDSAPVLRGFDPQDEFEPRIEPAPQPPQLDDRVEPEAPEPENEPAEVVASQPVEPANVGHPENLGHPGNNDLLEPAAAFAGVEAAAADGVYAAAFTPDLDSMFVQRAQEGDVVHAVAHSAPPVATRSPLAALERFRRKIEARRAQLASGSVA